MSNKHQELKNVLRKDYKDTLAKGYITGVESCIFGLRKEAQRYFNKNNDYVGKLLTAQALSIEEELLKLKKERKL